MTRIKICGITNFEDASAAIDSGADALGFIFVPNTPRFVGASPCLMELLESVPPFVSRVGVCRNPEDVKPDQRSRLEVLQIYNHKAIRPAGEVPQSIPVFRLRSSEDFDVMETALSNIGPQAMVLDAYTEFSLGGAGVSFDWSLAVEAKARFGVRVILAGGLTPENVADAIRQVRPYAVDVSSGVESSTVGRKDHEKLKKFMSAVRGA